MRDPQPTNEPTNLKVGSLFSGYGGLDLAVEQVFNAKTVWFSEINDPISRVFSHHWPDAPNLGDITSVDWKQVEPVEILCGGFPCQDVSTVGKMAGLAPGTRSGLWAHMAAAVDILQPEWVVVENVRGLLSATATRTSTERKNDAQRNSKHATPSHLESAPWNLGDFTTRPLRAAGAVLGDLADLGYDAQWLGLPASAVGAPHPRFRVFILAHRALQNSARLRRFPGWGKPGASSRTQGHYRAESPDHRSRTPRGERVSANAGSRNTVELCREDLQFWGRYAAAITQWVNITGRPVPAPALIRENTGPRPAPAFVEWLMGLPAGWVTNPKYGLTTNQQLAALGNGVLPEQAVSALNTLRRVLVL